MQFGAYGSDVRRSDFNARTLDSEGSRGDLALRKRNAVFHAFKKVVKIEGCDHLFNGRKMVECGGYAPPSLVSPQPSATCSQ